MIPVGILGATGVVGQNYIAKLQNHPWFFVNYLAASDQSKGKTYAEAVAKKWRLEKKPPSKVLQLNVHSLEEIAEAKKHCAIVFSALPNDAAKVYEEAYAKEGFAVISNASTHRMSEDIPILIPEINQDHLNIIKSQQNNRGWTKGFIAVKPNCSIQSFMIPLDPLHRKFQIRTIHVTTMQSISGAGYPGVPSHDILDNIIPFISGEEEKTEKEPLKIWGSISGKKIVSDNSITISAHCNRVPVMHGHMACLSVKFDQSPAIEEVLTNWRNYTPAIASLNLPSLPKTPIIYMDDPERPQSRLDRDLEDGMAIVIGRLRKCPLLDIRFVGLSHNVIRGAAGGGILNAELLHTLHYF